MARHLPALVRMLGLLVAASGCYASRSGPAATLGSIHYDPVTMDPPALDTAHPPRMAEIAFLSAGERLNGLLYVAAGAGPHPVVLLLHGNPGNERSLDVAQAVRRAGYTVFYFDYRGNWGSGGSFSRTHALEDVSAALRWVRSSTVARQFGIDTSRVALIGHSMGGWLALMSAAADPKVACVGALDARNVGAYGRQLQRDRRAEAALVTANDSLTAPGAPYRAEGGGAALVTEMKANAERWDVRGKAFAQRSPRPPHRRRVQGRPGQPRDGARPNGGSPGDRSRVAHNRPLLLRSADRARADGR